MKKKIKKYTSKEKIMQFKKFRRTHTLLYKKGKTLFITLHDDRVTYTYVSPVPIFRVSKDECVVMEGVMVCDKRTVSRINREEGGHD